MDTSFDYADLDEAPLKVIPKKPANSPPRLPLQLLSGAGGESEEANKNNPNNTSNAKLRSISLLETAKQAKKQLVDSICGVRDASSGRYNPTTTSATAGGARNKSTQPNTKNASPPQKGISTEGGVAAQSQYSIPTSKPPAFVQVKKIVEAILSQPSAVIPRSQPNQQQSHIKVAAVVSATTAVQNNRSRSLTNHNPATKAAAAVKENNLSKEKQSHTCIHKEDCEKNPALKKQSNNEVLREISTKSSKNNTWNAMEITSKKNEQKQQQEKQMNQKDNNDKDALELEDTGRFGNDRVMYDVPKEIEASFGQQTNKKQATIGTPKASAGFPSSTDDQVVGVASTSKKLRSTSAAVATQPKKEVTKDIPNKVSKSNGQMNQSRFDQKSNEILLRSESPSRSNQQAIHDMQILIDRMKQTNNNNLDKLEAYQLRERMVQSQVIDEQQLELESKVKRIALLKKENGDLQEVAEGCDMKVLKLQNKIRHFDTIKKNLEDEISNQQNLVSEAKIFAEGKVAQYSDLHSKHEKLKRAMDLLEREKNLILVNKLKEEAAVKEKLAMFECLNRQNLELTAEFERQNHDSKFQITQLMERVNSLTIKYAETKDLLEKSEKHARDEKHAKEKLQVELKLLQPMIKENSDLKKKVKQVQDKLEEVEGVVDDLKRKIRHTIDLDMREENRMRMKKQVERIIEKPIFVERQIDVAASSKQDMQLAKQYRSQMEQCLSELNDLKEIRAKEQEQYHKKVLECETWRTHATGMDNRHKDDFNNLKANADNSTNQNNQIIEQKDAEITTLNGKVHALLAEVEVLTNENIEKNRLIAESILHPDLIHSHLIPQGPQGSFNTTKTSYIPYGRFVE